MKIKDYQQMHNWLTHKPDQREKDLATIKRNALVDVKEKGLGLNTDEDFLFRMANDPKYTKYDMVNYVEDLTMLYDGKGASPKQMAELRKRLDKAREMTGGAAPNKNNLKNKKEKFKYVSWADTQTPKENKKEILTNWGSEKVKVAKGSPVQLELPLDNPNDNIIPFKPLPTSPLGSPAGWMDKVELQSDVLPGESLNDYMKRKEYEHQMNLVNEGLKIGIGTLMKIKNKRKET